MLHLAGKQLIERPAPGATPDSRFVRLASAGTAFDVFKETVDNGGEGRIEALWPGLPVSDVPVRFAAGM
jgi:hypothetical protein